MNNNPYTATIAEPTASDSKAASNSFFTMAKGVFLAWEQLRFLYVLVLAALSVSVLGLQPLKTIDKWIELIAAGVFANVFYMAGPIVETYLRWLGLKSLLPRWILFGSGLLFSMVLVVLVLNQ